MKPKPGLHVFSDSNQGLVRNNNEDYHSFCINISEKKDVWITSGGIRESSLMPDGAVFIVADGLGGLRAGEVASKLAVETVQNYIHELNTKENELDSNIRRFMEEALFLANEKLFQHQKYNPETKGMGTTLVIGWIYKDNIYVSWAGDSRCYCFNTRKGLKLLTKDHSYVQRLIDEGSITLHQAFSHPSRNIITQNLGNANRPLKPDFISHNVQRGDRILFCSDGLNGMLENSVIDSILRENENTEKCCSELIRWANIAGGRDNISVILCDLT